MATLAHPAARIRSDRLFYTSMGLAIAAVTFWGFARSYYLNNWLDTPPGFRELTPLLHFHGALFTAWILLGVVQPALIAGRNYRLHRRIGIAGAVLAAAMVVLGNVIAALSISWPVLAPFDPFAFYAIPFFAINTFAILVVLAIANRNRPETHKRLMLLAATQIVEAAIARVPVPLIADNFPFSFLVAADLIIVAGIVYDLATRRRVHPVWIWGGLLVVASQVLRLAVMTTEPWLRFAHLMAGLY